MRLLPFRDRRPPGDDETVPKLEASATVAGRTGSFLLQHSGTMTIEQDASGHRYTLDYTLPAQP